MSTKQAFEELLKGKLDEIADAVVKKIGEKDEDTAEDTAEETNKKLDNDDTHKDVTEIKLDEGAIGKIADAVIKKMKPDTTDETEEDDEEQDIQKNLVTLLKGSGIDPEKFDITISEKKSGDVLNAQDNKTGGEIKSEEDLEKRLNGLDEEQTKEALNVYFKNIILG